jgi:hypothetical protein
MTLVFPSSPFLCYIRKLSIEVGGASRRAGLKVKGQEFLPKTLSEAILKQSAP